MNKTNSVQPEKLNHFSLRKIKSKGADYNLIFGERSNGKTYAVLEEIVTRFWSSKNKSQGAIIRRWAEDFRGKRGQALFASLESNAYGINVIDKITKGEWTGIKYYSGKWFMSKYDETLGKDVMMETPLAYAFSIASQEHDKSISFPHVDTIMFDEFLTRGQYLQDEFVSFMNLVSTIVRNRSDVKIYMLGNTVNKYSPYFTEMGLKHISKMLPGDIDVYTYGDTDLKVAVQYADAMGKKESNKYFAFDNPKLNMITGGVWEMALYPHLPIKYEKSDIIFQYFIVFELDTLQCEIIDKDGGIFTYIHRKTSDIKDERTDLVYSSEFKHLPNWRRKITRPVDALDKKIASFFLKDKVFYQDNEVGEIVRNYLQWCNTKDFK